MGRRLTIGLTGGIAAGKSEALAAFGRLGAATVSSDEIVHELLADDELRSRIVDRWGEAVAPGGEVDRTRVGEIVFEDPAELSWLEQQLHPRVGERIGAWLGSLPDQVELAVIEVPLLFESGMEGLFDATVTVVAPDEVRRRRAAARGHGGLEGREGRQLEQSDKAARATHVVRNDGTVAELEQALSVLIGSLRRARPTAGSEPLQS
jgi:dephospho-CoA kinase